MEPEPRITRARRHRIAPPVEDPVEDNPGRETPWIYARRMLPGGETDLSHWVLHTSDCAIAPPRPVRKWPAPCGDPPGAQMAFGSEGISMALRDYLDLRNDACDLCRPGALLRENLPDDATVNIVWAERGGR